MRSPFLFIALLLCAAEPGSAQTQPPVSFGVFAEGAQEMSLYIKRVERGGVLSASEKETVHAIWIKQPIDDLDDTSPDDIDQLIDHYALSLQLALMLPQRHGGWPKRHPSLQFGEEATDALRQRFARGDSKAEWASPYELAATVILAYQGKDYSFSYLALQLLKDRSRFVYRKTLSWLIGIETKARAYSADADSFFEFYVTQVKEGKAGAELNQQGQWAVYVMYIRRSLGEFLKEEQANIRTQMYGGKPDQPTAP
jgi:hypothetical protein